MSSNMSDVNSSSIKINIKFVFYAIIIKYSICVIKSSLHTNTIPVRRFIYKTNITFKIPAQNLPSEESLYRNAAALIIFN